MQPCFAGHARDQDLQAEAVHGANGGAGRVRVGAAVEARLEGDRRGRPGRGDRGEVQVGGGAAGGREGEEGHRRGVDSAPLRARPGRLGAVRVQGMLYSDVVILL